MPETITFEDVMKVEMRVGEIMTAEEVVDSVKLLKLEVDFGKELGKRVIFAGIKKWYKAEDLEGTRTVFILNLEPKKMGNLGASEGMVLAVDVENGEGHRAVLLKPDADVPLGSRAL